MLKSPNDRRAIRTKKLIRNALSELIEEKGSGNISITDLTTRADINRGTFYLHYTDKYDLLEQVENEVMQELKEHAQVASFVDVLNANFVDSIDSANKPMSFMINIFEYLKENSKFMKAILGPKGDPKFHTKLKKFIEASIFGSQMVKVFKPENMLVPEAYFASYILSAHLGVIQQWLESGMEKSPEEMSLILSKMFFLGPFKVTGYKQDINPSH
ncbi:MAG: TetR/AcrR family transcriptional regulator [Caulobacteraceae bacterium]